MSGTIIKGSNLNLYYLLNGVNQPAAHATNCKISLTADTQETTTRNSLKGKTFDYLGKYSYTLTLDGITNYIDVANIGVFQDAIMKSNKLNFIFTDDFNVEWSGTILMTQNDVDSQLKDISTFTNAMLGDGELTRIDINTGPLPPLGNTVEIIDQFGDILANVVAPGTYSVLRFDNINCGNASTVSPLIVIQAQ